MALAASSPWWTNGDQFTGPQCFYWSKLATAQRWRCRIFILADRKKTGFFAIVTGWCIGFIKRRGLAGQHFFLFRAYLGALQNTLCSVLRSGHIFYKYFCGYVRDVEKLADHNWTNTFVDIQKNGFKCIPQWLSPELYPFLMITDISRWKCRVRSKSMRSFLFFGDA